MPFFRKIRSRILFLFLATGLLPALALAALLLGRATALLRDGIEGENRRVADQVTRLVETRFAEMRRDLERLASDPAVRAFRAGALGETLRAFFQFVPLFYNVHLYDATGTLRAVEYYTAYNDKRDRVGEAKVGESPEPIRRVLEATLAGGGGGVSGIFLNSSGERIVVVTCPVHAAGGDGRPDGVLSAALKLEDIYFHRILESVHLDEGRYVVLADYDGTVLSTKGAIPEDLHRYDFRGARPYLGADDGDYDGLVDVNGRRDYITCRGIPSLDGNLITGRPYRLAFAPLAGLLSAVFWVCAGVCLLFPPVAWAVGTTLSAPIGRLVEALRRMREGELAHRIPEGGDDEFGEAALAFNDLAEKLHRASVIDALWRETR